MGKGITFTDTQGHHGSQKCLPLRSLFEDNKPLEEMKKGKSRIAVLIQKTLMLCGRESITTVSQPQSLEDGEAVAYILEL